MLLLLTKQWMEALNVRKEIRAVSLDISHAVDTVWHPALLSKLSAYGIQNQHDFLTSTLKANMWLSKESFHLLSQLRMECPKAVILAQSSS